MFDREKGTDRPSSMEKVESALSEIGKLAETRVTRRGLLQGTALATIALIGWGGGQDGADASATPGAAIDTSRGLSASAWKFGIVADTQWTIADDGKNPNGTAVDIINQLNRRLIAHGVKFVVQVGDLTEKAYKNTQTIPTTAKKTAGGVTTTYTYTNIAAEDMHASFVQALYNAGIGFFPLRGNHDSDPTTATEFKRIYPQTKNGTMNATPADVLSMHNPDAATQPLPAPSGSSWRMGRNFDSPGAADGLTDNLQGLSYAFEYENVRFVMIDQFNTPDNLLPDGSAAYNSSKSARQQQPWISRALVAGGVDHKFVFSHKGLITQQHQDVLFGDCPADADAAYNYTDTSGAARSVTRTGAVGMNDFIRSMYKNGTRIYFCGHDHIHDRSVVWSTDDNAKTAGGAHVTHVLCQSCSSKFYTSNENNDAGDVYPVPRLTSNNDFYCKGKRQTQLSMENYTVGYYIVTVGGQNVTVDYYSAPSHATSITNSAKSFAAATPTLMFTKRETFGYGVRGREFIVEQGATYTVVRDTSPSGTEARILSGTNRSRVRDSSGSGTGRYSVAVNTGWSARIAELAGDVFLLWGMNYTLGSEETDVFTLSLSYDAAGLAASRMQSGAFGVATLDSRCHWINAVSANFGGARNFVPGPWKPGYGLGACGIDTATNTAWAVVNHNGAFAVKTQFD